MLGSIGKFDFRPVMFVRLTALDAPQPPHPIPSAHSSHKGCLTFAGVVKMVLKIKRLGNPELADARDARKSQCSMLQPVDSPSIPPTGWTAQTVPSVPSSPQCAKTSSEGTGTASPPSPSSPLASHASFSSSSRPGSPKQKHHHLESSSGQIPLSHSGLAEHACQRRESIERIDTYHCSGGVNVPVLLRSTRSELMDIASILGANALVEEEYVSGQQHIFRQFSNSTPRWKCIISSPRSRNKLTYKVQVSSLLLLCHVGR